MAALRAGEDLTRTWLCVDMDAFFAACEELDNPALVPPQPREVQPVSGTNWYCTVSLLITVNCIVLHNIDMPTCRIGDHIACKFQCCNRCFYTR